MVVAEFIRPRPDVQELSERKDIRGLAKALRYRRDTNVRLAATAALAKIGGATAARHLAQALKYKFVRWEAAAALEMIGEPAKEPLAQALDSEDVYVRKVAEKALRNIDQSCFN